MVVCASCGTSNDDGRKFCGECGSALVEDAPTPVARAAPAAERKLVSVLFADLVGFTEIASQLSPARLVDHAAGRGARIMQVVGEAGIGWQLARIWTGTRTRERSLKRSGGAARRCPVCQLAALCLQPPRPVDPLALELGVRVAASAGALVSLELPPGRAA